MARRRASQKRKILPDPKFQSELIAKFINHVMQRGKKSLAEHIVYGALDEAVKRLKSKEKREGLEGVDLNEAIEAVSLKVLEKALDKVRPTVEVRSRRVGGSTYQVPIEVRASRQNALAMKWLVESAKARSEKNMAFRLAAEILDATSGRGNAVKKREDMHKMAMANQAFAHYRWD